MPGSLLDDLQWNPQRIQKGDVEMPQGVKPGRLDAERAEQWPQLALTVEIHVPRCSVPRREQELVPLALLPCDLLPNQRNKLRRESQRPHRVIGFRALLLAVPN